MEFIFEVCVMFGLKRAGTILVEKLGIKRKTLEKKTFILFLLPTKKDGSRKKWGQFRKRGFGK